MILLKSNSFYSCLGRIAKTNCVQVERVLKLHISALSKFKCELTADRYNVKRQHFNKLSDIDIEYFKSVLEDHRVLTSQSDLFGYNTDWLGICRGSSSLLLKPKTTKEVSKILAYCNENNLAVCPQGGNTGLVGGSVPVFDEIIISTSLLNKMECIDKHSGVIKCQAGCILENLIQIASENDLVIPYDLGAKGSCHIGGNVATNAGGIRLLRYGNLHGAISGLEIVLANGEILDCLSEMRKDNTGYSLKNLFIGSEGTLGFITKVSIFCPPKPTNVVVAFLGVNDFKSVIETFQKSKKYLGEILSSCEFMDSVSMDAVNTNLKLNSPIGSHKFYMLIETSGTNVNHDEEKMNNFLGHIMTEGLVQDGTLATEPSKIDQIWAVRERIAEALLKDGYAYKYDISIPLVSFYEVVEKMADRLKMADARVCGYGHVGDGNLHFNVTTEQFDREVHELIEPHIFELTRTLKGSISAEHGLGFKKSQFMHYSRSDSAINTMKNIKNLFDPKGILNPYKVLPK